MYWNINNYEASDFFNITLLATVYRNDWLTLTTNCLFAMQPLSAISMKPPIRFWLFNLLFWFTRSKYIRNKIEIDYLPRYWAFCIRKPRFQWRKHKKCYSWGRTRWNLYIRYWKLWGFTWTCVHRWRMCKS